MSNYLYAAPGSKIYHRVETSNWNENEHFACDVNKDTHSLMSMRLADGVMKTPDQYGHRRCKRCFP